MSTPHPSPPPSPSSPAPPASAPPPPPAPAPRPHAPPPLRALQRASRHLPQTLLPHPALPASHSTNESWRRRPLGRTSPHLRLLRPVPLRQRLPRLLRPQRHRLLHH